MKKGLGKLYDRFTPDERFRLAIEALARGDEEEAERLKDTCPPATYRMLELAYTDRCKVSMTITLGLCLDLAPPLVTLKTIQIFRETLALIHNIYEDVATLAYLDGHEAGSKRAWEVAGKPGNPPGWEKGKEADEEDENPAMEEALEEITSRLEKVAGRFVIHLQESERANIESALTVWEPFARFCHEELLVEPEKLVKVWFEPMLPEIEKLKNLPDLPEMDPEKLKEYEASLRQVWSKLVRSN